AAAGVAWPHGRPTAQLRSAPPRAVDGGPRRRRARLGLAADLPGLGARTDRELGAGPHLASRGRCVPRARAVRRRAGGTRGTSLTRDEPPRAEGGRPDGARWHPLRGPAPRLAGAVRLPLPACRRAGPCGVVRRGPAKSE